MSLPGRQTAELVQVVIMMMMMMMMMVMMRKRMMIMMMMRRRKIIRGKCFRVVELAGMAVKSY